MQTDIVDALDSWEHYWGQTQEAAALALRTAFPLLVECPQFVGCDHLRLEYEADEDSGRVCVDENRATIEISGVPNGVLARAVDEIGFPYLDSAAGPLSEAPPGTYTYECEASASVFEFTLADEGRGKVDIWGATIPDAVHVLNALRQALEEGADTAEQ
ncbi:hypothetical protein [Streptomyces sp. bgisy060]|uniref:hypothetical protein n=1 Tax=Streptomyces sp. bgisy060 TaxID=3413775 RepID=UPI003EB88FE0